MPIRILFPALLAVLLAAPVAAQPAADSLDGRWQGRLEAFSAQGGAGSLRQTGAAEFAFQISGDTARVFARQRDGWGEIKPGSFHIGRERANAVIYSLTSAGDDSAAGGWAETWNFTVTRKDAGALSVVLTRMISTQLRQSEGDDDAATGPALVSAVGEMTRAAP